jgi:hypothetical protein
MMKSNFGFVIVISLLLAGCSPMGDHLSVADQPKSGMLAPDGTPRESYLAPFPLTIVMDGKFDDWVGVPRVMVPPDADMKSDDPRITFAAAADDASLYVAVDVIDANIISGQHGTDYWNEDSVEVYVNATGDLSLTEYADGVTQITIPTLNLNQAIDTAILGGTRYETTGARVVMVKTDRGYALELALPLQNSVWNIPLEEGGVIGFQVHLNGASVMDRDTKLIWSALDVADQSYLDPSVFGRLIFHRIEE